MTKKDNSKESAPEQVDTENMSEEELEEYINSDIKNKQDLAKEKQTKEEPKQEKKEVPAPAEEKESEDKAENKDKSKEGDSTIPEKFKGKTAEEIAKSYVELERAKSKRDMELAALKKKQAKNSPSAQEDAQPQEEVDPTQAKLAELDAWKREQTVERELANFDKDLADVFIDIDGQSWSIKDLTEAIYRANQEYYSAFASPIEEAKNDIVGENLSKIVDAQVEARAKKQKELQQERERDLENAHVEGQSDSDSDEGTVDFDSLSLEEMEDIINKQAKSQ